MMAPSALHRRLIGSSARCCASSNAGPPTLTDRAPTVTVTPTAGTEEKSAASGIRSPRASAAVTTARAKGCSLGSSAAAAKARTWSSVYPAAGAMPSTAGSPLVKVPVLSNSTVSTVRMLSSAIRSFTRTPPRAARSVAIETTNGIARPSACGQAITNTVIVRTTAMSGTPSSVQTTAVTAAAPSANQKSQAAAVSANRCAREEEFCASATKRWIPAKAVSSPTAVISRRRPESTATVPATTASPTPRRTASDSPVTMDSSMLAEPSRIRPSAGIDPPGRTMTTSPSANPAGATLTICPSTRRSASSGSRAASESSAEEVWASERISIQCPRSMITTSSASSHQKFNSWSSRPRLDPQEARKATVMANPIKSIIPGLRLLISLTAPVRNGAPPQKYTTLPSTGETQGRPGRSGNE